MIINNNYFSEHIDMITESWFRITKKWKYFSYALKILPYTTNSDRTLRVYSEKVKYLSASTKHHQLGILIPTLEMRTPPLRVKKQIFMLRLCLGFGYHLIML